MPIKAAERADLYLNRASDDLAEVKRSLSMLEKKLKDWEENAEYLLQSLPRAVRVREGGGPENLMHSLILNFIDIRDKAYPK